MTDKKWYQDKELRALQKQWYAKLEDDGFFDIEGGVEGHLLKGPASRVSLRSLANKQANTGQHLKNDRAPRDFDEVADDENELINYAEGGKARYYHHAQLLVAQAFREGRIMAERCWCWAIHAQGDGERVISDLTGAPRSRIRKHLKVLRDNVLERIDNDYT